MMVLDQYECPGCQTPIAAPFLSPRMEVICPECGNRHQPPEVDPSRDPVDWTPTGEPLATLRPTRSTLAARQILLGLTVLGGLAFVGIAVWMIVANPGQVSVLLQWGMALAFLAFGAWIAKTGWSRLRTLLDQSRRMAVRIYDEGFSVEGFGHSGSCRWDDFQAVVLAHPMTSPLLENNPLLIAKRSGDALLVDSALHRNPAVVSALEERSLPVLLPEYWEKLTAGGRISFIDYAPAPLREDPTLHVTGEGIEQGDRKIPWEKIKSIDFRRGNLTITPTEGETISYNNPLTIPNAHILVAILRGAGS